MKMFRMAKGKEIEVSCRHWAFVPEYHISDSWSNTGRTKLMGWWSWSWSEFGDRLSNCWNTEEMRACFESP